MPARSSTSVSPTNLAGVSLWTPHRRWSGTARRLIRQCGPVQPRRDVRQRNGARRTRGRQSPGGRAADQDYAGAQFNLGVMYEGGLGVPQDYAQAMEWWRKAAEQGDPSAQLNLGAMFAEGRGVAQDYAQAVAWWRKAAEQEDARAQSDLAAMCMLRVAESPRTPQRPLCGGVARPSRETLTHSSTSAGCTPAAQVSRRIPSRAVEWWRR